VCANCGYGRAVTLFSSFCFLLDSDEDYEPEGRDWYGTIMVSLVNRLTVESVQGLT